MSFSRNPKNQPKASQQPKTGPKLEYVITRAQPCGVDAVRIKKDVMQPDDLALIEKLTGETISRERIAIPDSAPRYTIELRGKQRPRVMEFGAKGLFETMLPSDAEQLYKQLDEMIDRLAKEQPQHSR